MTRDELKTHVLSALASVSPELDESSLDAKAPLRDTLDLDSMDYLRFIVALHEDLGVSVPEKDYRRMTTLDGCLDYLAERLRAA